MTYRWLTDLDQALDAGGVPYVPIMEHGADYTASSSWQTRGRPASTGDFDPAGVLCHHTASPPGTSDDADINCLLWGNTQAPGPVSQLYLGRTGTLYLLAAGRCNHGGGGIRPGVDGDCTDMNAALIGIEAGNAGTGAEVWGDAQTDMYAATVAALCLWYGWPRDAIYLHATTGPPSGGCNSKIDPAGPWQRQPHLGAGTWDLELWRDFCVEAAGDPLPDEEDPLSALSHDEQRALFDRVNAIFWMVGNTTPTPEAESTTVSALMREVHWMVGNQHIEGGIETVSSDARAARANTERLLQQ